MISGQKLDSNAETACPRNYQLINTRFHVERIVESKKTGKNRFPYDMPPLIKFRPQLWPGKINLNRKSKRVRRSYMELGV